MIARIAAFVRGAAGWRKRTITFLAGAAGALALAPFGFFPAMVISLSLAVWLLDSAVSRAAAPSRPEASLSTSTRWPGRGAMRRAISAASCGWWFGFGYFTAGLWWLGAAFLVEAEEFAWALPLGVLGLPAVLAFFPAAGFGLAGLLWRSGPLRILTFAGALGAADYLRGVLFTGFPWNTFGMALAEHAPTAQAAAVVGQYGLSVLCVLIAAAPATLADCADAPRAPWRRLAPTGLAACLLAALTLGGWLRVPSGPPRFVDGVKLRLMQPAMSQDSRRFNWDNRHEIMARYLALSDGPDHALSSGASGVTHLIWPESSFPFLLEKTPEALDAIASLLPAGAVLITGAARAESATPGARPDKFYNSIQVVDHRGDIIGTYDKSRLVPFGEYLPLNGVLEWLGVRQFVHIPGGFTAGLPHGALNAPGLPPTTPLICYEAIFPGFGAPRQRDGGVLLNVTNDGWFGNTPGPYQHLSLARLRAIEQGLPLVRAANSGISAVIDSWGRTNTLLSVNKTGVLDARLPEAQPPTLYARGGDLAFAMLVLCCLFCGVVLPDPRERRYGP